MTESVEGCQIRPSDVAISDAIRGENTAWQSFERTIGVRESELSSDRSSQTDAICICTEIPDQEQAAAIAGMANLRSLSPEIAEQPPINSRKAYTAAFI